MRHRPEDPTAFIGQRERELSDEAWEAWRLEDRLRDMADREFLDRRIASQEFTTARERGAR